MATIHQARSASALHDIDLRELSEYEGPEQAFLTLYVDGDDGVNSLDQRLDRVRSTLEGEEVALEHFEQNVDLARQWLESYPPNGGSACVFVCFALDLCKGWRFDDLELPTTVHVGVSPWVRPLAELQDEYETFAVVTADNRSSQLFLVTSTEGELASSVRGDVKNHVKKGGWSQKRYQRRRDNQLQHYADDIVEQLRDLHSRHEFERIVMLGSEETLVAIEERLDDALAELVVAKQGYDLHNGEAETMAAAFACFEEAEREAERGLWEEIRAEVQSGGLATLGPTDVLGAIQHGRVEAVLIDRELEVRGTRCKECDAVVHGTPDSCQKCGSRSLVEIDLVNEIARQAELTSAQVDFADPIPGLTRAGGMGALLRYQV